MWALKILKLFCWKSHDWHRYWPSTIWLRRCTEELAENLNACGQRPHLNGCSPVCMPMWFLRPGARMKYWSQCGQLNLRICECDAKWMSLSCLRLKRRSQIAHVKRYSLSCTTWWRLRNNFCVNFAEQRWQPNGLQQRKQKYCSWIRVRQCDYKKRIKGKHRL